MKRWRAPSLVALALLILCTSATNAQTTTVPFTGNAPSGWQWWRGEPGFMLLPDDASTGDQGRFFLVVPGNRVDEWLPGWMGGGEIVWEGQIEANGATWDTRLARGGGKRGLVGVSQDGQWTFAAVSPEGQWQSADAALYNAILKGEVQ